MPWVNEHESESCDGCVFYAWKIYKFTDGSRCPASVHSDCGQHGLIYKLPIADDVPEDVVSAFAKWRIGLGKE